jgi:hypothetical protein
MRRLRNDYVSAVASNNIVAIRKDKDLFDSLKRLKSIDTDALSEKLTSEQLESILCNRALILCLMNKVWIQNEYFNDLTYTSSHGLRIIIKINLD